MPFRAILAMNACIFFQYNILIKRLVCGDRLRICSKNTDRYNDATIRPYMEPPSKARIL
jgi:hypothetical protein